MSLLALQVKVKKRGREREKERDKACGLVNHTSLSVRWMFMQPGSATLQAASPLSVISAPPLSEAPSLPLCLSFSLSLYLPSCFIHEWYDPLSFSTQGSHRPRLSYMGRHAHTGLFYCTSGLLLCCFSNGH